MTDYAAAAVQPIVQGLVTIPSGVPGGAILFSGKGALPAGSRLPAFPTGVIILTLDAGLPGNAGAIEPVPAPVTVPRLAAPFAPLARTLLTMRSPAIGVPTTIVSVSVAYGNFTVPAPADGSLRQVAITLANTAGALIDPIPVGGEAPGGADGFEIIVWEGVEQP
ncbi:MAG TPA: hypothetical protein VFA98_15415 [Thermoanaerobaculia bacterium]|jgi:hypothetical protein|nr:hypothetical protein [Thermoanaerobaculia bacterium]